MEAMHRFVEVLKTTPLFIAFITVAGIALLARWRFQHGLKNAEKELRKQSFEPPKENTPAKREELTSSIESYKKNLDVAWFMAEIFAVAAFLAFVRPWLYLDALWRYVTGQISAGYNREVMLQASHEPEREGRSTLILLVLLVGVMLISAIVEYFRGRAKRIQANLPVESRGEEEQTTGRATRVVANAFEAVVFPLRWAVAALVLLVVLSVIRDALS